MVYIFAEYKRSYSQSSDWGVIILHLEETPVSTGGYDPNVFYKNKKQKNWTRNGVNDCHTTQIREL